MPLLATLLRARCRSPYAAYLAAQARLMEIWVRRGMGSEAEFVERLSPRFRTRFGSLLEGSTR